MKYGKLFNKYFNTCPNSNKLPANRLSQLKHSDLRHMAKNLYASGYKINSYQNLTTDTLRHELFVTLSNI